MGMMGEQNLVNAGIPEVTTGIGKKATVEWNGRQQAQTHNFEKAVASRSSSRHTEVGGESTQVRSKKAT
jgi:hypothetical protein